MERTFRRQQEQINAVFSICVPAAPPGLVATAQAAAITVPQSALSASDFYYTDLIGGDLGCFNLARTKKGADSRQPLLLLLTALFLMALQADVTPGAAARAGDRASYQQVILNRRAVVDVVA